MTMEKEGQHAILHDSAVVGAEASLTHDVNDGIGVVRPGKRGDGASDGPLEAVCSCVLGRTNSAAVVG
jgi:hypothetical protein